MTEDKLNTLLYQATDLYVSLREWQATLPERSVHRMQTARLAGVLDQWCRFMEECRELEEIESHECDP